MSQPPPATTARQAGPAPRQRRRSQPSAPASSAGSSAAESLVDTAKHVEAKVERALLLLWDDLPPWRRDNAFILSGYRPTSNSYRASLASALSVHNETVNIWSHLLGALGFAGALLGASFAVAPRYASASAADVLVFACFFAGACACLGMSATYHAVLNHSPEVARWGNKLDYSGIVFLIVGSYVPTLYYGFFCHPTLMITYLYMICILGAGCLTVSWFEHFRTPEWRPYRALMFVCLGLSGVVPVIQGLCMYGVQDMHRRMGLGWVLLQGALYIAGAAIYASRWPEKMAPGKFDIWGSSHQIFHVFVVLAAAAHLYGQAQAFDYHHSILGAQC